MKTLIFLLAITFGTTTDISPINYNNTEPEKKELNSSPLNTTLTIIEEINFQMSERDVELHVRKINYNTDNSNLSITANRDITFLQLVNQQGVVDFQLPVFSETVTINLNDLEKGKWKLHIMIDNDTIIPASFQNI